MPIGLPKLTGRHYEALTNIMLRSSALEVTIEHALDMILIDKRKTSKYLLKHLTGDRLIGVLHSFLVDEFQEEASAIDQLIDRIAKLRSERNELTHWLVDTGEDSSSIRLSQLRPHRKSIEKLKNVDEMRKLADAIAQVSEELEAWAERAGKRTLSAWQDRAKWHRYLSSKSDNSSVEVK